MKKHIGIVTNAQALENTEKFQRARDEERKRERERERERERGLYKDFRVHERRMPKGNMKLTKRFKRYTEGIKAHKEIWETLNLRKQAPF